MRKGKLGADRKYKLYRGAAFFLSLPLLLSGCSGVKGPEQSGGKEGDKQTQTGGLPTAGTRQEAQGPFYSFEITQIPSAERNLAKLAPDEGYLTDYLHSGGLGSYFTYQNGTLYRTAAIVEVNEEENWIETNPYFQYLEAPYQEWVNLPVESEEGRLEQIRVTPEGQILCLFSEWTEDGQAYFVEEMAKDGSRKLQKEAIPEEELDSIWSTESTVYEEYYDMYAIAGSSHPAMCVDDKENLWFGTEQKLWCYDGKEAKEVLDFREYDIAMKELHSVEVTEDGFVFLGSFSDRYYLIRAHQTKEQQKVEKTEIVLADIFIPDELKDAIADFNMQSREYRVVTKSLPMTAQEGDRDQFQEKLLKEVLQKGGPDILGNYALSNVRDAARNGYLLPLDDYFQGKEDQFWPAALESGMYYGKRYEIPYSMIISYLVGDGRKLPEQDSWNARELMAYVRESGAQKANCNKYRIGSYYQTLSELLDDPSDPTYIDWEKGISHLEEKPFLDLLSFVKEYAISEYPSFESCGEKLQSGEYALLSAGYQSNMDLIFQDKLYQGNMKIIGFPSAAGNGVRVTTLGVKVNANTEHKEGVYEFLDYLLSDEGQMNVFTVPYPDTLPVRKETYMWMLDTKGEGTAYETAQIYMMGVPFRYRRLQGEVRETAISLAENAVPYDPGFLEIQGMITEETDPYFAGERSLQETAKILHNRVQLYLNER